jgi:uncharacterized protein (DUF1800 family)
VDASGLAFEFRQDMHVPGQKVLLEQTIPGTGIEEGKAVLDMLARNPSTARFIATKLARRFVSDEPPAALVDRVAQVYSDTDGNISAMVRTILTSPEFSAPAAIRAKAKSPFEAVVSAVRAIDAVMLDSIDSQSAQGAMRGIPAGDIVLTKSGGSRIRVSPAIILTRVIQDMGQFSYQVPEPTGYPDRSDYWMAGWNVFNRTKFAVALVNNEVLGTTVDADRLAQVFKGNPTGDDAWKSALSEVLLPTAVQTKSKSTPAPADSNDAVGGAFALALGSPQFQQK